MFDIHFTWMKGYLPLLSYKNTQKYFFGFTISDSIQILMLQECDLT